jgi:hypothetical protein
VKLEEGCRYVVSFKFSDDGDIMKEGIGPSLDSTKVFRRPCSFLEPKPTPRYGEVLLVDIILDGQSSIPVEFVEVERVEFVFEDFVQESRLDRGESWMDLSDFGGYLTFVLVIVVFSSSSSCSWCCCCC